jgi:hypothetical protein
MFVSDGYKTYFMSGLDPEEFTLVKVADFPAIAGTDLKVDGSLVGAQGIAGDVILWLSSEGICVGGNQGFFKNLTQDYYVPPRTDPGAAHLRKAKGSYQFIVVNRQPDWGGAPVAPSLVIRQRTRKHVIHIMPYFKARG